MANGNSTSSIEKDDIYHYQEHVSDVLTESYSILAYMADAAVALQESNLSKHEAGAWGAHYILNQVSKKLRALSELDIREATWVRGLGIKSNLEDAA